MTVTVELLLFKFWINDLFFGSSFVCSGTPSPLLLFFLLQRININIFLGVIVLAAFLTEIGTFFTEAVGWMTEILSTVTSSAPLTVLVLGFPIVGFAFGILKRLISM